MHSERHRNTNIGWMRAAVLGANDGLISTSSLVVGVASATQSSRDPILLAAVAGLVAGALSMAAGEYVSVSSQADTEQADLARERHELTTAPDAELRELTNIFIGRGLTPDLAQQVAEQLTAKDALAAHAREELGILEETMANPLQAALASAAAFVVGALPPVLLTLFLPMQILTTAVGGVTLLLLLALGTVAAQLGGAGLMKGAARVAFWGVVAMGCTMLVGHLFGTAVV